MKVVTVDLSSFTTEEIHNNISLTINCFSTSVTTTGLTSHYRHTSILGRCLTDWIQNIQSERCEVQIAELMKIQMFRNMMPCPRTLNMELDSKEECHNFLHRGLQCFRWRVCLRPQIGRKRERNVKIPALSPFLLKKKKGPYSVRLGARGGKGG